MNFTEYLRISVKENRRLYNAIHPDSIYFVFILRRVFLWYLYTTAKLKEKQLQSY